MLIQFSDSPNERSAYGDTPIQIAARNKRRRYAQIILISFGITPMGYAAIAGHTDIIEILSQFWANFVKIFTIYCKDGIWIGNYACIQIYFEKI